jgi:hypothetical protein
MSDESSAPATQEVQPATVSSSTSGKVEEIESNTKYGVFRKIFHVPRVWSQKEKLNALFEHRYFVKNASETFDFVSTTLKGEGYLDEHHKMEHDYLHFMTMDLLDQEKIAYICEDQIRGDTYISNLLFNLTPDLIVKSSEARKTTIIDFYAGAKESDALIEKKSKYKQISFQFEFRIVTPTNFTKTLTGVLTQKSVAYLSDHYAIFNTEYAYWRACVKLRGIIRNDVLNKPIVSIEKDVELDLSSDFLANLSARARVLLMKTDI